MSAFTTAEIMEEEIYEDFDYCYEEDDAEERALDQAEESMDVDPHPGSVDSCGVPYRVITFSDALGLCTYVIKEVSQWLQLSEDHATILLLQQQWNKENISDLYILDPAACLLQAGLVVCPKQQVNLTCGICWDELSEMLDPGCGHLYCRECFTSYLESRLTVEEFDPLHTLCPCDGCPLALPPSLFQSFVSPELYTRYQSIMVHQFVDSSWHLRYCPGYKCDLLYTGFGATDIVCSCSCLFCLQCGREAHYPITCTEHKLWNEQSDIVLDKGCSSYLTKRCPGCDVLIEKTGGCKHMTCTLCRYQFCWSCSLAFHEGPCIAENSFGALLIELKKDRTVTEKLQNGSKYFKQYGQIQKKSNFINLVADRIVDSTYPSRQVWEFSCVLKEAILRLKGHYTILKYTVVLLYLYPSTATSLTKDKLLHQHDVLLRHAQCVHDSIEKGVEWLASKEDQSIARQDLITQLNGMARMKTNLIEEIVECRSNFGS